MLDYEAAQYLTILTDMVDSIHDAGFDKSVIMTGGFTLDAKLLNNDLSAYARVTRDIDLSIKDEKSYIQLFDNIEDILNKNKSGAVYSLTKRRGLKNGSDSVELLCTCEGVSTKVKVDMNIKNFDNIGMCYIDGVLLPVYDDYTALVDKMSVVCSDRIYRRIKDLYDMYAYSKMVSYSYYTIYKRFVAFREDQLDLLKVMLIPDNIPKLKHAYEVNTQVNETPFEEVFIEASKFVNPLLSMLIHKEATESVWDVTRRVWK